jgi:hypothetical protein
MGCREDQGTTWSEMRKKGRPAGEGDRGNKICKGTSKAGRSLASPTPTTRRFPRKRSRSIRFCTGTNSKGRFSIRWPLVDACMHCHIQCLWSSPASLLSGRSALVAHVSTRLPSGSRAPFLLAAATSSTIHAYSISTFQKEQKSGFPRSNNLKYKCTTKILISMMYNKYYLTIGHLIKHILL